MSETQETAHADPATARSARRWYQPPEPRRRSDLMGISSTVWMAVGWILLVLLVLFPFPFAWWW